MDQPTLSPAAAMSGPLLAAASALLITSATRALSMPVWTTAIAATGAGALAVLIGHLVAAPVALTGFRVASFAVAGAWGMWVTLTGWSWLAIFSLSGTTVAACMLASVLSADVPKRVDQQPVVSSLPGIIARVCGIGEPVKITDRRTWPTGAGYNLHIEFSPGTGHTWRILRDRQVNVAAALRLPPGCPVAAMPSPQHQGAALLSVATRNTLDEVRHYPREYGPLSIRDAHTIGWHHDDTPVRLSLYQDAALIVGMRGQGKTIILQGVNANVARCADSLVWHVDLNGGGMSAPWTGPYARGEIDTPVIDWVASTPAEGFQLAHTALAIAKDRKARYQALMLEHNTDILPVSPALPAIIIIVDEGGELAGTDASTQARDAAAALREVQRIGRSVCVNVIFSVQRATADYVSSQQRKGSATTIAVKVSDEAELAHALGWHRGISFDQIRRKGQAFIEQDVDAGDDSIDGPLRLMRSFLLGPQQIRDIAHAVSPLRPTLDPAGIMIGGEVYAQRWTRPDVATFLGGLRGVAIPASPVDVSAASRHQSASATVLGELDDLANLTCADDTEEDQERVDDAIRKILEDDECEYEHETRKRFLAILRENGPLRTGEVAHAAAQAGLTNRRPTVSEWLARELKMGTVCNPERGIWDAAPRE